MGNIKTTRSCNFHPLPPKAKVRGSNPLGRASSVHAIGAKRRRFCAAFDDQAASET
jgi:hypothetical protein